MLVLGIAVGHGSNQKVDIIAMNGMALSTIITISSGSRQPLLYDPIQPHMIHEYCGKLL